MQQPLLNGRYQVEQKIGEGGMATVYQARDIRLNRRVAVKMLHAHYANDPEFLSRFQHEAQAAAGLSHRNVVNVYDVGQDGNTHYIVMEYIEGVNLKTLIHREGPLPIEQAIMIAEEVALGLEAAHRYGLIHRDIKPQNILVSNDGHVRITDFGIAKSHLSTTATQTGVTFGTADYISPEQAQGQQATPRSDIYSLGITLYEMLTGRLPFIGDSPVAVAMQHVSSEPPPIRRLNPQVPPQLEAFVLRALSKDPYQRPASAREFAQILSSYRGHAGQATLAVNPVAPKTPITGPLGGDSSMTGRSNFPPPPSVSRAPQQQSQSCGIMFVGSLIFLVGLFAVLFFLNFGAIGGNGPRIPIANSSPTISPIEPTETPRVTNTPLIRTPIASPTEEETETPTPTDEPTNEPTSLPTQIPTPSPTSIPPVVMPSIVGLSEAQALQALHDAGLQPIFGGSRHDNLIGEGLIVEQSIPPGELTEIDTAVTYFLSLGPNLITIPDFRSRPGELAVSQATELGLSVQTIDEPSQDVSPGFVIRHEPNPGERVPPGFPIRIIISVGDQIRFPNVIGLSRAEAEGIIAMTEGLSLVYVDEQGRDRLANFDQYRPNEVVSALANDQPVHNGNFVPRGSTIVLGVRAPE